MLGPNLHINTDLKKNYKFVWALDKEGKDLQGGFWGMVNAYVNESKKMIELTAAVAKLVGGFLKKNKDNGAAMFTAACDLLTIVATQSGMLLDYVSQMTKSVVLPDDEIEMDEYEIGNIKYPVPKSKKIGDIVVTYYDDSCDTVYSFHKSWLELAVPKSESGANLFSMRAFGLPANNWGRKNPTNFCHKATFATYENTLNTVDYVAAGWANKGISAAKGAVTKAFDSVVGGAAKEVLSTVGGVAKTFLPFDKVDADPYLKYKFKQTFTQIFPVQIKRSSADKGGSEVATVEVTYRRVPDIVGMLSKPCVSDNNYGY
jgi:hypothetical protein